MTDVTVINTTTSVAAADDGVGPAVVIEVIGPPIIQASTIGIQGPAGSGGGGSSAWADITGKPAFAAVATSGAYSDLTGLPSLFDGAYSSLSGLPTLGTAAATASTAYATAAQGTNADTAHGWGNHAIAGYLTAVGWADVTGKPAFFSGAYADLTGKPTLGTAAATNSTAYATAAQGASADTAFGWGNHASAGYLTTVAWGAVTGKPSFATVATSGAYADLTGKPTLGSAAATDSTAYAAAAAGVPVGGTTGQVLAKSSDTDLAIAWVTPSGGGGAVAWADVTGKPTFATVSTTGAYSDLSGLPTLFSGAYADLTGKPALFDGAYASLTGKPTLGTAAATASTDYATAAQGANGATAFGWGNHASAGYLTSVSWAAVTGKPSFATVATSGAYADLSGKPTLGTAAATDSTAYAAAAASVPAGGTTGQVLAKSSGTDYALAWSTPSSGGGGVEEPWRYVTLASDNIVSTTALADVTGMSFEAVANATYEVEVFGAFQTAATTTGMKLAFSIPSGTITGMALLSSTNTAPQHSIQRASDAAIAPTTGVPTLNADLPVFGKYLIAIGSTGGTVQLRQGSEVASSNTTLVAGLRLKYRQPETGGGTALVDMNAQTGTAYTLALTDAGKKITCSNASANTVTVPANATTAFPVGTIISVSQTGAGVTSVVGASGVTINGASAATGAIAARWSGVTLTKLDTNTWIAEGNVGAFA
jgi:hypothetical protein